MPNNLTIIRFAHAFESGGGTERYLDDLDRALLERHAITIIRLHLTRDPVDRPPSEQIIGSGRLILVPLRFIPATPSLAEPDEHSLRFRLKQVVRDWILYNPLVWRLGGRRHVQSISLPRQAGQAVGAGAIARQFFQTHRVDLVMLHFFGGADADEVLVEAKAAGVPVALLNHYANDRLRHMAIRKHVLAAEKVTGVSGLHVPAFAKHGFTNLSDGIDTNFFRKDLARPLAKPPSEPVILLPGRIIREKGQLDLVKAAARLKKQGIACSLAFAGRVDSSGFVSELKELITREGLEAQVHFLGALNLEELRDWYAASFAMALPTYHHEGLPRVLLEAQAMQLPCVAYATGGVAQGIADQKTGFLLRTGDLSGLTEKLGELLSSVELRHTMGKEGRALAETQFSLSALSERHMRCYREIVAEHTRRNSRPTR